MSFLLKILRVLGQIMSSSWNPVRREVAALRRRGCRRKWIGCQFDLNLKLPLLCYSWERLQYEWRELDSWISRCSSTIGERTGKQSKNATEEEKNPKSKPYDNAYFFIFFVMLVCSFLALTVFSGYSCSEKAISKKDLYHFSESKREIRMWPVHGGELIHRNKATVLNSCRVLSHKGCRYLIQLIPAR